MGAVFNMTEITVLVGLIGAAVAVLTYFAGQKHQSNKDVEKRAYFEGTITAKLDQLISRFDKLEEKLSSSTSELYDEINLKISEHEKRYHNGT